MICNVEVPLYSEDVEVIVPIFSKVLDFVITSEYSGRIIFEHSGFETETKKIYFKVKKIDPTIVYPPFTYFKSFTSYRSDLSTICNGNSVTTNVMTIPLTHYIYLNENFSIRESRDSSITEIIG